MKIKNNLKILKKYLRKADIKTNKKLLGYFKGRNFRGKKLLRFRKTAKYLHFAGINFRG